MIRFEHVTKIYPGQSECAVTDLTLEVPEGETCVLVGPSGCGKTTTMKMVNRLIEPTSGTIYVGGKDVTKMDPIELRRGIGYVIQEIGLFPHMSITNNIATVANLLGWDKERISARVDELLRLMGMEPAEFRNRYPHELSGGQKQRIGVARALGVDPPVMLMDEPFGAIDPITRERLQNEFLRLQEKLKKTVIFVTHDINEAIKMGNKIAILQVGGILEQYGTPDEILAYPANRFVEDFVGADRTLKRLNLVRVYEVMDDHPFTAMTTQSIEEVEEYMRKENVDNLLVIDPGRVLKGYVSWKTLQGKRGWISDVVHPVATTVGMEATLKDALSEMLTCDIGYVCVVDDETRLRGLITSSALQKYAGETYTERGGV